MPTNTATLERTIARAEHMELEQATADFFAVRPRLHGVAYRIVGNWSVAEDIVQDAWVKWQTCQRHEVRNPTAFLVTITTRLAINTATLPVPATSRVSATGRSSRPISVTIRQPSPNETKRSNSALCSSSNGCPQPNVLRTCFGTRSIIRTQPSLRCCNSPKRTSARSSAGQVATWRLIAASRWTSPTIGAS